MTAGSEIRCGAAQLARSLMLVAGTTHFSATCPDVNIEVAGNQENRTAGEQRSHTNLFNIARPTHTS